MTDLAAHALFEAFVLYRRQRGPIAAREVLQLLMLDLDDSTARTAWGSVPLDQPPAHAEVVSLPPRGRG